MAWGLSQHAGPDDLLDVTYLHAADLRFSFELLVTGLVQVEELLGDLEANLGEN
jgi:hypothetical protein